MDWNITMIIGFAIAMGGLFLCMSIVAYCNIRMEFYLKAHGVKIPLLHFYRPFIVYREYCRLTTSKSVGPEKEKLNRKIVLTKRALLYAPIILIIGLLVMVIGKSL